MMKKECELWLVCGPGAIYHYHGKYLFSNADPRRNYRDNFCLGDFKKCDHFFTNSIREVMKVEKKDI